MRTRARGSRQNVTALPCQSSSQCQFSTRSPSYPVSRVKSWLVVVVRFAAGLRDPLEHAGMSLSRSAKVKVKESRAMQQSINARHDRSPVVCSFQLSRKAVARKSGSQRAGLSVFSESSLALAGLDSQECAQIRFGAWARTINLISR